MITNVFLAFLQSRNAITDYTDQIYLWPMPTNNKTWPAITFHQDNEDRSNHFTGPSGLVKTSVVLDCFDKSSDGVKNLAQSIVLDLKGYRGFIETVQCYRVDVDRAIDLYEEETELFRVSISLSIWHKEI